MNIINTAKQAGLLGAVCLLAAGSGQALAMQGPVLSNCTTLNGTNGVVTVTECAFQGGSGPVSYGGTYGISVSGTKASSAVAAFHVSTNNPLSDPDDTGEYLPFTTRSGWRASAFSADDWNQTFSARYGKSFADFFGSDLGAYVFQTSMRMDKSGNLVPDNPLEVDSEVFARSLTFGWYGGAPNSHFVAFNGNAVVSQSLPVPEPSAYALMLAGLGGLGWLVRRRKAFAKAAG